MVNTEPLNSGVRNFINPFSHCTLCTKNDRPIDKCPNFSTATEKLSRLEILEGCTFCANIDHRIDRCMF